MKSQNNPIIALSCAASLVFACQASAVTTVIYDFQSLNAGVDNGDVQLNGQDNWTANSLITVALPPAPGTNKNLVGWTNENIVNGNRLNDANFAMTMSSSITQFSLSADVRIGAFNNEIRRAMFGLTVGSGSLLFGAGGDDTQGNKWLILGGNETKNFSNAVTTSASSVFGTVRLDVDLTANSGDGAASLYFDNVSISDLQNINLNLKSLTGYSDGSSFDGMAISLGDFGRLDNLTLSYIPEPTAALLGSLGLLALLRRRRA
jgi:hypothetical protein